MTSFLANLPKKSNFRVKFRLIFATFCQKLPCRTLLQATRGHLVTNEGRQWSGTLKIGGVVTKWTLVGLKTDKYGMFLPKKSIFACCQPEIRICSGRGGGGIQCLVGPNGYQT